MSDQNDIPGVSMANTKKELLEAYQNLKNRLKSNQKDLLDAEKTRKQMAQKLAQTEAEVQSTQDPVQRLHELRASIGNELVSLAEKFERELDTFKKIQSAVESKQQDLKTIYGVETAASDLAALIEAQHAKKREFEEQMATQRVDFENEINETRSRWHAEDAQREQTLKEAAESIKKQRLREKEEFEYSFARERAQLKNKLEDESQALEKETAQKRTEFEHEYQQRSAELEAREKTVAGQEAEMAALAKQVEAFPAELERQIKAAVTAATERLTSDFEKTKALLEAKHEGEKNVLTSKLESLENMVKSYQTQVTDLAKRHDQAYEKVQDIANRAVSAAKREFVSMPTSSADKNDRSNN